MRKILTYIICLFCLLKVNGQADPQFSQFYSNPLYLGASFAGAVDGSRISISHRDQWRQAPGVFTATSVSYDHYIPTFNSGIGILAYRDISGSGELGSKNLSLLYSYNFQVYNVWHIRPGISFSYIQHGLSKGLTYMDQIVGVSDGSGAPALGGTAHDVDAGTSVLVYTKKFWIGSSVDHILTPEITLSEVNTQIPLKFSLYGGYELRRKGTLLKPSDETLTFAYMYKKQGDIQQLDLGVYWHRYPFVIGGWYRGIPVYSDRGDAVVFLFGIKTRSFNIGYSYDLTISNLLGNVGSTHEVSISYKFLLPKRVKKGGVPCPEF